MSPLYLRMMSTEVKRMIQHCDCVQKAGIKEESCELLICGLTQEIVKDTKLEKARSHLGLELIVGPWDWYGTTTTNEASDHI